MKKSIIAFISLITLCIEPLMASAEFSFKKYQVENGLSHNTTWCAIQDSYGFLWIGTSNGLNCYYGSGNKIYRNVLNDKYSLGNNFVSSLMEEGEDLWIGTSSGLYIYDRSDDHFLYFDKTTKYGVFISCEVKKIVKTKNGLIWIATLGQGIFIYDPAKDVLTQNSIRTFFAWDICQGTDSLVYVSSMQEGLLCFDEEGTFLQNYPVSSELSIGNQRINCLHSIEHEIWCGVGTNSLGCYQEGSRELKIYDTSAESFSSILCLMDYSEKEMLVGTDNGVYLFDRERKTFRRGDSPFGLWTLSDPTVHAMMWDNEGTLWVMTNSGGINYMSKQSKRFSTYSLSLTGMEKADRGIGPFCEDREKNVWVGTRNGLWFFNSQTHSFYEYSLKKSNIRYDVRSLLLEGDNLWVGTYAEGLHVLNLKTGNIKSYTYSRNIPNTLCSNDVLSLFKDRKGEIFIGTSWGLCRYNPQSDNFITVINVGAMASVTDIYEDMYNNLWIATSNRGVFCYNTIGEEWKHFEHIREDLTTITSNSVITLFEDRKGTMWFGTNGGGLCSFSKETETFVDFDPENVWLPDKVIYSIEQDQAGNFWISCNSGLYQFNPTDKNKNRLFTINDGLQGNQFTAQSSLASSTGKLYFGGVNGFNVFEPKEFADNTYLPPVYVMDISFPNLNNEREVRRLLQLDKPFYTVDKIRLPYKNNSLTIRFATLSYEDPLRNRYAYILNGVDKEWINNSSNNTASYTNLPPGEYEFLVRGSNNDHYWNEKAISLWIVVTPPWWRTTIAYVVYALLLLAVIVFLGWRWNLYVRRKYKRRMEEYQTTKEKEMYKSKINFFINLVHEIRTPLSLIRLPLEKLREEEIKGKENKYISVIEKNVDYLLGIINQLLDFQKLESSALQLNLRKCNVNALVSDIFNQFSGSAELRGLTLHLCLPREEINTMIDSEKISKILVNLMGNAMKYAKSRIELKVLSVDDEVRIVVTDDGPGIPEDQHDKIFQAFYQLPDDPVASSKGTGIGLAFARSLAEAHHGNLFLEDSSEEGASFVLSLPLGVVETEDASDGLTETDVVGVGEEVTSVSEFGNRKFTVLLVEDNIELLNLTREALSVWFKVIRAGNGKEALEILAHQGVDVIVSDIMMPEMDGLELCNHVKSDMAYSHIPVVLLTAKTTLESKVEGLESGADVYLEKPFSIKQLHKQIENLLKLRLAFHKQMTDITIGSSSSLSDFAISQKDVEFIDKINAILLEQVVNENYSIETLADQMNMSHSNLYRKMKSLFGMPPNNYVKNFRLNKAAELIANGVRIAEAAERLGFASSSHFAKCFKEKFGMLPKDYR